QGQRLEALDDLVHVLEDALDGLVLVHHAIEPEAPDRAAPQRGEEEPAQRVAEGVAEAALERLQAELRDVRIVVPLRHLDEVRADQSGQINAHGHFEYSSTMRCSWALTGMASRVGTSTRRPAALSASTESQLTCCPREASSWAILTARLSRLDATTRTSWPGAT